MTARYFHVVAFTILVGCAGGSTRLPVGSRMGPYLSAAEVTEAHAELWTAYDAIARLRPNWMASHGTTTVDTPASAYATVFVDGQQLGDLSTLRNIPAGHVKDFRYYDVTQAGGTFGLKAGSGGVIELRVK